MSVPFQEEAEPDPQQVMDLVAKYFEKLPPPVREYFLELPTEEMLQKIIDFNTPGV